VTSPSSSRAPHTSTEADSGFYTHSVLPAILGTRQQMPIQKSGYPVQALYFGPPCKAGEVSFITPPGFPFLLSLDTEYYIFYHFWKQITALDYIS